MQANAGDGGPFQTAAQAEAARSLLGWWAEAGCDTLVADRPRAWATPAHAPARAVARPASGLSSPAHSGPADPLAAIDSLAALAAFVRETAPGAPFSDGDPASGFMIMGEGPSEADLASGRPWSGPAGLLLDRMLKAIGRDRSRAYLSLLCPRKATPGPATPADIARDSALAFRHVALARPRVLLLMGGPAAQTLLADPTPIGRLRGRWHPIAPEGKRVRALATFNPAYLLRRPEDKRVAWEDLLEVARVLDAGDEEGQQ